ncbi:MAG: C-terminal binding protein [Oscillospiraceae bacterium]
MNYKIVVTDYLFDNLDAFSKPLESIGASVSMYQHREPEDVIPIVKDADIVFVHHAKITREVIGAMANCKMIVRPAIGFDNIDVEAATEKKIFVTNIPDYGAQYDVSDHAIMLLLACAKKLWLLAKNVKDGVWDYNLAKPVYRVRNQKLGLVGFGKIPQRVASKAKALDMDVIAYDPYLPAEAAEKSGVKLVDFDTLVRDSDFISIHSPLNRSTYHMFNRDVFDRMKPTAFVINTARGGVINEADLIEALKSGRIAGAGLDVVENEIMAADHPFVSMDNVIVTPHSAWYSVDSEEALLSLSAEEVIRTLKDGAPLNYVNDFGKK